MTARDLIDIAGPDVALKIAGVSKGLEIPNLRAVEIVLRHDSIRHQWHVLNWTIERIMQHHSISRRQILRIITATKN